MNWLDVALDDAERYMKDAELSLFEDDYAGEGLRLLRANSDVLSKLGKPEFAKSMIFRAAGNTEEARQAVLGASSWEARRLMRAGARDEVRHDDEASEVWSILGGLAVTMVRAALPFILAAVIED